MNKNYTRKRPYKKRRSNNKTSSPQLMWLLLGIVIGMIVPCSLYIKMHHSNSSSLSKVTYSTNDEPEKPLKINKPVTVKVAKNHHTTHSLPEHHSEYDFYNMLSSQEDSPSKKTTDAAEISQEKTNTVSKKFTLEIGGAFETFEEADQLKAQLALTGFDINISKDISNNQLFYHVTTGPFASEKEALNVQKKLKENHFKSSLVSKDP